MDTKNIPLSSKIFLGIIAAIIAFSSLQAVLELVKLSGLRQQHPFAFGGEAFAGVKDLIRGERAVGYITDKDFKIDKNIAEFSQAQFSLVPVILDFNNPNHRFLLINCADPRRAAMVLQYYKAIPIKKSSQGAMLAVREGP
jgi:hypothetical protein